MNKITNIDNYVIIKDHINNFLTGIITIYIDFDDFNYFISVIVTIANYYRRVGFLFSIGSGTMRNRITAYYCCC